MIGVSVFSVVPNLDGWIAKFDLDGWIAHFSVALTRDYCVKAVIRHLSIKVMSSFSLWTGKSEPD